jgi:hypothetical protein
MFSLQQNWRTREQNRFFLEVGWGAMYTHVSKCKNDKIKKSFHNEKKKSGTGTVNLHC